MRTTAKKYSCITALTALVTLPGLAQAEEYVIPLGDFGGRPMVEVTIGSHGPFNMILDTGAPSVILDKGIGTDLGLTVIGEQQMGSPGGKGITAVIFEGAVVGLGEYTFEAEAITGMDFSMFKRKTAPDSISTSAQRQDFPPGVFGFWALQEGVVSIDYKAHTLTINTDAALNPADPAVLKLARTPPFPYPEFEMTVGGIAIKGHIDSGSGGLFTMSTDWIDKLPLKEEAKVMGQAMLADGPREIWGAQLDGDVVIGGQTIKDPQISFMNNINGVNVGSGFFKEGGFRIDRENDLIEFIYNARDEN